MSYHLSATKLQAYSRCAFAYYLRYERRLSTNEFFGSAALGTALHQALAVLYRDWHYEAPKPSLDWVHHCWNESIVGLSPTQIEQGRRMLEHYYETYIASAPAFRPPLAVEGKVQATFQVENLEFAITGRYDRLDFLEDGLELIDYKSTRDSKVPARDEVDSQIGLYFLALEQTYRKSLKSLSLLFLRTGEKVCFEATERHKERVTQMISDLAVRLRQDQTWEPTPGKQCDRCSYARYCSAATAQPSPLPATLNASPELQLVLGV